MSVRSLDGLLVVALEQAVAAPFCTSRLADAGARVIKIERAEGDFARSYDRFAAGESSYFVWLNRGKESIALDFKDPADLALLRRLIARADVLVQNLAPGAMERAGLGIPELRRSHPGLVICSICGFGSGSIYASRKAYDLLMQAESGMCSVTGSPEGPGRIGVSGCDISTGMYAHAAILDALIGRSVTGQGRSIEISMFDAMADWMAVPFMQFKGTGQGPRRLGLAHASIAPYGVYASGDGAQILVAVQNPREWNSLCVNLLADPGLIDDSRFIDNVSRVEHRTALDAIVAAGFARFDRPSLIAALTAADIAFGVLNDVAGLAAHPALRLIDVETPAGMVEVPAPPGLIDQMPMVPTGPMPSLDQHGAAIRVEFALS